MYRGRKNISSWECKGSTSLTHLAWFGRVWRCGNGVSVLAQSRNSLNMTGRNERDKAHFPRRAQDKISPRGDEHTALVRSSEEGSFVRTQGICKGERGETSANVGCVGGEAP